MIKVEHQTPEMTPGHDAVVFASKQDADSQNLQKAIGRFDAPRRSIAFLKGTPQGDKYSALHNSGFKLFLTQDERNNFYINQIVDAIKHATGQIQESDEIESTEFDTKLTEYVEHDEFMEQYIDSAQSIRFTTPKMKHYHQVGLINETHNVFTTRPEIADLLNEFEVTDEIDEEEEPFKLVDNGSVKGTNLVELMEYLNDDDEEELEESESVNFGAMESVKRLLNSVTVHQKHGDFEKAEEAEESLRELISQYGSANPPAEGVDEVEDELNQLVSVTEQSKRLRNKFKKTAKKVGSSAKSSTKSALRKSMDNQNPKESLSEKLKREADIARLTMNILEQDGVSMKGQQETGVSYVY
ncbi:hypothetical protein K6754_23830 [Vibrio alginolyticus]|uniref:hypothetical protein n=1 Tax=Vibrio alginolyticus TaxID=663 RepID=UPI001EF01064|nr:hypothetical protein [Vibrio alginolyticus]EMC8460727.1 hypothetical protein [Vibrio alginolyticus]EME3934704.1 hypothetical protein [Vibrio alginolyticus]ULF93924.1 hypothetical protein K6754_23830 [Vibrio alginolyticus]